jgi:hypothetical protein
MRYGLLVLVAALTFTTRYAFAQDKGPVTIKWLKITVGDRIVSAIVIDSETARDFLTLLPMTVKANDYVSREKYWPLPKMLAVGHDRQSEYERGDLGFWIPGNSMALFYNHDGSTFSNPGFIVVAKITSNLKFLNSFPGSVELKIELVEYKEKNSG